MGTYSSFLVCCILVTLLVEIDASPKNTAKVKRDSEVTSTENENGVAEVPATPIKGPESGDLSSNKKSDKHKVANKKGPKKGEMDDKIQNDKDNEVLPSKSEGEEDNENCPGVICSPPPSHSPDSGFKCVKESLTETNIQPQVLPAVDSTKSDCCPVHVCTRPDGTKFTHYGLQSSDPNGHVHQQHSQFQHNSPGMWQSGYVSSYQNENQILGKSRPGQQQQRRVIPGFRPYQFGTGFGTGFGSGFGWNQPWMNNNYMYGPWYNNWAYPGFGGGMHMGPFFRRKRFDSD